MIDNRTDLDKEASTWTRRVGHRIVLFWWLIFLINLFSSDCYAFLPAAAIPAASSSGPAAPFVIGGIAAFTFFKSFFSNPLGQLKVHLTNVYEGAQEGLEENVARYLEEPASIQAQQERLAYFDKIWEMLKQESLKTAQGMISWNERQRNGRWCWECYYRDPIANDPRLQGNTVGSPVVINESPTVPPNSTPVQPEIASASVSEFLAVSIFLLLLAYIIWWR